MHTPFPSAPILKQKSSDSTAYEFGVVGLGYGAWSSDSQAICLSWSRNEQSELLILRTSGEERVLTPPAAAQYYTPMDWSLDGKNIVCKAQRIPEDHDLVLVSESDGSVRELGVSGSLARFSPDGRFLAYEGVKSNTGNLFVFDLDRNLERQTTAHAESDASPVWTADGRHLVFGSHRRQSWDLWALAVEDGMAQTSPFLLRGGLGEGVNTRDTNGDLVCQTLVSIFDPKYVEVSRNPSPHLGPPNRFGSLSYERRIFLGWSPSGNQIASFKNIDTPESLLEVSVTSLENGSERTYSPEFPTQEPFFFRHAFWTRNGESMAIIDRNVVLLNLESGVTKVAVKDLASVFANLLGEDILNELTGNFNLLSVRPTGWSTNANELLFRLGTSPILFRSQLGSTNPAPRHVAVSLDSGVARIVAIPDTIRDCDFRKPSPDGSHVLYVADRGRSLIYTTVESGQPHDLVRLETGAKKWIGEPEWSPNGAMIAYPVDSEDGIREVHMIDMRNKKAHAIHLKQTIRDRNKPLHWSPDSQKTGFTQSETITEIAVLKNVERMISEQATHAGPPEI